MARPPVVAIFNTSPDKVDVPRIAFEYEGFVAVSAFTFEIREGEIDLAAFFALHRPDVVVYDIVVPYHANWQLFMHLRRQPPMQGVPVVITTSNAAQVRPLTSGEAVHEIVGKPYDLQQLIALVRQAVSNACERRH
jgi:CheY-like chemotaxis protein